ncbi:hypothetical protein SDC9_153327 [bioreactor metagenome]|uniref:Uncharacterized protein n=1 Tax=bioreactor metagenome TaxID=1076179 RepID=A0A645EXV0_9ZZZZ
MIEPEAAGLIRRKDFRMGGVVKADRHCRIIIRALHVNCSVYGDMGCLQFPFRNRKGAVGQHRDGICMAVSLEVCLGEADPSGVVALGNAE